VDGGSGDTTAEIAQQFQTEGLQVRVIQNAKRTRGAALNRGIQAAKGEVILCLDARNLCPPEYIRSCVAKLIETGADNVGGVIQPICKTPTQLAIGLAMSHPFGVGNAPFRLGNRRGDVPSVYLGCFRRSVFDQVGSFDESADVSEDSEMNLRIRRVGGRVYLDPEIKMPYHGRDRLRELWRLYWRYGIQRVGTLLKHKRLTAPRQILPASFLCSLAVLGVASLWKAEFFGGLCGLSGIYLVVDFLVSAKLSYAARKVGLLPRLIAAFPCMHFAYGLAFISRLVRRPRSDRFLQA
jgi:glycosyltransferase involved in cell wall biosynthesis